MTVESEDKRPSWQRYVDNHYAQKVYVDEHFATKSGQKKYIEAVLKGFSEALGDVVSEALKRRDVEIKELRAQIGALKGKSK